MKTLKTILFLLSFLTLLSLFTVCNLTAPSGDDGDGGTTSSTGVSSSSSSLSSSVPVSSSSESSIVSSSSSESSSVVTSNSSLSSSIPSNGLVGEWLFIDNANDTSGYNNNGTVNGASLATDRFGKSNNAYGFDGIDDFIEISRGNLDNFGLNSFTISIWYKGSDNDFVLYDYRPFIYEVHQVCLQNNVVFRAGTYDSLIYNNNISNNNWHHLVFKRDMNFRKIIIDNIEVASDSNIKNLSDYNKLFIGCENGSGGNAFLNGFVDDIRIYNMALSESEIQELYQEDGWGESGSSSSSSSILVSSSSSSMESSSSSSFSSSSSSSSMEMLFIDNGDGTMSDTRSNLMWLKTMDIGIRSWSDSYNYCQNLEFAGYDDWRMPTIDEYQAFALGCGSNVITWLTAMGFIVQESQSFYWSSTQYDLNRAYGYVFQQFGSILVTYKSYTYGVWPVRNRNSSSSFSNSSSSSVESNSSSSSSSSFTTSSSSSSSSSTSSIPSLIDAQSNYALAFAQSITDLSMAMALDPLYTDGTKTYTVNGSQGGTASLTLTFNSSTFTYQYQYNWNNYKHSDVTLNGSLSYSYSLSSGGSMIGTLNFIYAGINGTAVYNCTISTMGVISGTYTINYNGQSDIFNL